MAPDIVFLFICMLNTRNWCEWYYLDILSEDPPGVPPNTSVVKRRQIFTIEVFKRTLGKTWWDLIISLLLTLRSLYMVLVAVVGIYVRQFNTTKQHETEPSPNSWLHSYHKATRIMWNQNSSLPLSHVVVSMDRSNQTVSPKNKVWSKFKAYFISKIYSHEANLCHLRWVWAIARVLESRLALEIEILRTIDFTVDLPRGMASGSETSRG